MGGWILNNIKGYLEKDNEEDSKFLITSNSNLAILLDETILEIQNDSLQKLLQSLNISQIVKALKGSSEKVRNYILSNTKGQVVKLLIIDELENTEVENESIFEAQQEILDVVQKLREDGEI